MPLPHGIQKPLEPNLFGQSSPDVRFSDKSCSEVWFLDIYCTVGGIICKKSFKLYNPIVSEVIRWVIENVYKKLLPLFREWKWCESVTIYNELTLPPVCPNYCSVWSQQLRYRLSVWNSEIRTGMDFRHSNCSVCKPKVGFKTFFSKCVWNLNFQISDIFMKSQSSVVSEIRNHKSLDFRHFRISGVRISDIYCNSIVLPKQATSLKFATQISLLHNF